MGRNGCFIGYLRKLRLRTAFVGDAVNTMNKIPWNSDRVHRYCRDIRVLKEQMLVLIRMTGGSARPWDRNHQYRTPEQRR